MASTTDEATDQPQPDEASGPTGLVDATDSPFVRTFLADSPGYYTTEENRLGTYDLATHQVGKEIANAIRRQNKLFDALVDEVRQLREQLSN